MPSTLRLAVLLLCALVGAAPTASSQDRGAELTKAYHELAAAGDADGLVELWRAHPDMVLPVIDADLEGALRLVESSGRPDAEAVAALHQRALFGARAAERVAGHPILRDYAASFVGWDAGQQQRFRAGQQAFGRARKAAAEGDHETALAAAVECRELAEPLGDWWGTAMGLGAEGQALLALGRHEQALAALSRARLLNHDLGLFGSESRNLLGMVEALSALGRTARLTVALDQAVALAERLGDADGLARLREQAEALTGSAPR